MSIVTTPLPHQLPPAMRYARTAQIHMPQHLGSWSSYLRRVPATVVPEVRKAISRDVNVASDVKRGVGTNGGKVDKWIGGAFGVGLMLSVMESFMNLADEYALGDIIIITGFSRGAYAARILAALIAVIGLPKTHKLSPARHDELFRRIYKGLTSGDLWIPIKLAEIRDGYKFHDQVQIEALCIFDTVTSVGLPKSGAGRLLRPFLRILPSLRKEYTHLEEIICNVPSNVRNVWHAVSIHETRATYRDRIARQTQYRAEQNFVQMWFFGNHGNLAQDNGRSCMVDAPLAWMLGLLHEHLPYLRFNENFLHQRFPLYPASMKVTLPPSTITHPPLVADGQANSSFAAGTSSADTGTSLDAINSVSSSPPPHQLPDIPLQSLPVWIHDPVQEPSRLTSFLHGYEQRTPGGYGPHTNEAVNSTVRLRGFGRNREEASMIPGYAPEQKRDGSWQWKKEANPRPRAWTGLWMRAQEDPDALPEIPEGKMTVLEKALLGLS